MEVDDSKRFEPSKYKVTAEADVDNETANEPKKNESGVATIKSKLGDKNKKVCKESFLRVQLKSKQ